MTDGTSTVKRTFSRPTVKKAKLSEWTFPALSKAGKYWTIVPFFLVAGLYEVVPLVMILARGFIDPKGGLTLQHYADIFSKPVYLDSIFNSVYVSFLSAFFGLVIAFLTALSLTSCGKRFQEFYISFLNITSNFSGIPLAFAFIILLGSAGVFVLLGKSGGISWLANFNLYGKEGITLLYIYFQIPLGTLMLIPAFDGIKKEWKESSQLMNASGFYFWRKVGIPVLTPSLIGTFTILFANALTAYASVYALVSNTFLILPIKISEMFVGDVAQRPEFGSALSTVMLLILVAVLGLGNLMKKRYARMEAR